MADGQLIFKPETQYDIKVAKGTISIDFSDIELPSKINKMYEETQQAFDTADKEIKKLESQGQADTDAVFNLNYKAIKQIFKSVDKLFGEGSADMIFPIKSVGAIKMFLDLLPAELDKAQEKANVFMEDIISDENRSKYEPTVKDNEEIEEL